MGTKDGKALNVPVFVQAKVIKNIMASAAEAEVAVLYLNAQEALLPIQQFLIEMGHPQPATQTNTDEHRQSDSNWHINGTIK